MTTMKEIESAAKAYSDAREVLTSLVDLINKQIAEIYGLHLKSLRQRVTTARTLEAKLKEKIEASPTLFDKPKTQTFHGIKCGFRKGVGGLEWEDDADVIKLIRKNFPEMEGVLIHTEETPVKKALLGLEVSQLKKLGITVEETGDIVVVKATDSAVDKTVKALLKNSPEDAV